MKKCSTCGNNKSLAEFGKNVSQKDGLANQCLICARQAKSKWKKTNRAAANAQMRRAYAKDPKKGRKRIKDYRKKNPGIVAAQAMKRYAAILFRTPKWLTEGAWIEIKWAYTIVAEKTKRTGIKYEVDHIIPLQGKDISGLHVPWNLQILTKRANTRKGNRI